MAVVPYQNISKEVGGGFFKLNWCLCPHSLLPSYPCPQMLLTGVLRTWVAWVAGSFLPSFCLCRSFCGSADFCKPRWPSMPWSLMLPCFSCCLSFPWLPRSASVLPSLIWPLPSYFLCLKPQCFQEASMDLSMPPLPLLCALLTSCAYLHLCAWFQPLAPCIAFVWCFIQMPGIK